MATDRPIEQCCVCNDATGRAGAGDGSLYSDSGKGPFCESCYRGTQYIDDELRTVLAAKEKLERELADEKQQVANLEEYMLKGVAFRDELQAQLCRAHEELGYGRKCICDDYSDHPCPVHTIAPCRHAAIAERVEDTKGMARFLYEIETGKNWYDLSEKGKTLWEEPAAAILKYLEGK